ncbi:MAG: 2-amino-4-hydroxy-6-hydroxymethyldihydropteridine diphosphokinase [Planctomycetes bacterium]|nr:2-amino-4-hydroxy-6-hydroxymethyldihydropteridine diphosphokinase [Planctomycetota bacterium]
MTVVYLGLGSNLGDRELLLKNAVSALTQIDGVAQLKLSSIIETSAVGGPTQPDYLNGVAELHCSISAHQLLQHIQAIERQGGRQRNGKNHPRTIDIDILLFGNSEINTPELVVPHPRMMLRDFVLQPLSEFLPEYASHVTAKV